MKKITALLFAVTLLASPIAFADLDDDLAFFCEEAGGTWNSKTGECD